MVENLERERYAPRLLGQMNFAGKALKLCHVMQKMAVVSALHWALLFQCLWSVSWSAKKPAGGTKAASVVTLDIEHSFDSVHFSRR